MATSSVGLTRPRQEGLAAQAGSDQRITQAQAAILFDSSECKRTNPSHCGQPSRADQILTRDMHPQAALKSSMCRCSTTSCGWQPTDVMAQLGLL